MPPAPHSAPVPPQHLEAEESVLGALMLGATSPLEIVRPADFYRESHGRIFQAVLDLNAAGEPVDAITVADHLESRPAIGHAAANALEQVGGRVRVHELAALVPATANAGHYARIVRDTAMLREMIVVGGRIQQLGWERPGDLPDLLEHVERLAFDLTQAHHTDGGFVPAGEVVGEAVARLRELHERGDTVVGVPSGFRDLDDYTAGWQPGNLVVIAARPSMGKSALAIACAAHAAIRCGIPVGLFTLEMGRAEVVQRLLSTEGLVESQRLRNGSLGLEDWERVYHAADLVAKAPLFIDDSGLLTMTELRSQARRLKARCPDLGLVVVDYLQLMTSGGSQESRVQEVSAISRQLKALARELDLPVIALSQLSRGPEGRHDKRPLLSDLRESGSIEQDADLVLFIYRDDYYHPEDTDQAGVAEVNVAKHRNGPTGTRKLAFVKRFARFSDLAPGQG